MIYELIDSLPNAVLLKDSNGLIVYASKPTESIFGRGVSELVGKEMMSLLAEDEREKYSKYREDFYSKENLKKESSQEEFIAKATHGRLVPIGIRLKQISKDGINYSLVYLSDLSERIEGEQTFKGMIESAPVAMLAINNAGSIILSNKQTTKLFGYTVEEMIGRPVEMLIPKRHRDGHIKLRRGFAENPIARSMGAGKTLPGLKRNGEEFPLEVGLSFTNSDEGLLVFATMADLSERKKTQELIISRAAAEHASKLKSEFLASMSHEIRTPLNGIIGLIRMLSSSPLNEQQRAYIDHLLRSSVNLLTILNDVLDFSKIEAGKLELESVVFDLDELINDTCFLFASRAKEKGVAIACDCEKITSNVKGDETRLRQVLTNLVSNALKFTDRGTVKLRTSINNKMDNNFICRFEVIDSGVGISAEGRDRIFKAFSQAEESITRKFGGTGLGLSISKNLIKLMNGKIGFQSEEGKGSVFWFEVPLELSNEEKRSPGQFRELTSKEISCLKNKRALIVEDDEINQLVIESFIKTYGMGITIVSNGEAAIDQIAKTKYDIVFMDCHLPLMDGFEATQHIRKLCEYDDMPIIALTANVVKEDQAKCLEVGMDDFVTKPFLGNEIDAILRKWVLKDR